MKEEIEDLIEYCKLMHDKCAERNRTLNLEGNVDAQDVYEEMAERLRIVLKNSKRREREW